MVILVYFSSVTGNTKRLAEKTGLPLAEIGLRKADPELIVAEPFVLIVPSYNGVPKQVIRFLNNPDNRKWIRGVIGTGNLNFGCLYGCAALVVAKKCNVPMLGLFELAGMPGDENKITQAISGIEKESDLK